MDLVIFHNDIDSFNCLHLIKKFEEAERSFMFLQDSDGAELGGTLACNEVTRVFLMMTPKFVENQELLPSLRLASEATEAKFFVFNCSAQLQDFRVQVAVDLDFSRHKFFGYRDTTSIRVKSVICEEPYRAPERNVPMFK